MGRVGFVGLRLVAVVVFTRMLPFDDRSARQPRPSGNRLRECPPAPAYQLVPPPLLHCAGHPTPLAAGTVADQAIEARLRALVMPGEAVVMQHYIAER